LAPEFGDRQTTPTRLGLDALRSIPAVRGFHKEAAGLARRGVEGNLDLDPPLGAEKMDLLAAHKPLAAGGHELPPIGCAPNRMREANMGRIWLPAGLKVARLMARRLM
jgi:hypothetical protein